MALDNFCHVGHTAVANFHVISVKYLVQCMPPGEMFVDQTEEGSCNIRLDINALWWVEPNDAITICRDVIPDKLKAFTIATGLEGIIVDL